MILCCCGLTTGTAHNCKIRKVGIQVGKELELLDFSIILYNRRQLVFAFTLRHPRKN